MSRKDSLIQIETANMKKLTEAMENLLVNFLVFVDSKEEKKSDFVSQGIQEFSDDYMHLLQNSDLTNDHERMMCIQAATLLTQALSVQLQPGERRCLINERRKFIDEIRLGMEKMSAIRQRRDLLDQTQKAFSLRCKNFLSSKFVYHVRVFETICRTFSRRCLGSRIRRSIRIGRKRIAASQ